MEQRGDLRRGAVPRIGCYPQLVQSTQPQRPSLAIPLQHYGGSFEERAIGIQTNRRVAAGVLPRAGDVGMLENLSLPDFLYREDVARPVFLKHEMQRAKRSGRIRIGFLKPGGAAIFVLEYFQNLIPDPQNCFSRRAQSKQVPLNSLALASESRYRRADGSATIILRIARWALRRGPFAGREWLTDRFGFHCRSAGPWALLRAHLIFRQRHNPP